MLIHDNDTQSVIKISQPLHVLKDKGLKSSLLELKKNVSLICMQKKETLNRLQTNNFDKKRSHHKGSVRLTKEATHSGAILDYDRGYRFPKRTRALTSIARQIIGKVRLWSHDTVLSNITPAWKRNKSLPWSNTSCKTK